MVRCQCIFFSKWQLTWRRPTQRRSTSISHVPISLALGEEKMVHVDIFFKAFPRKHHSWISAFLAGKHEALPEYRGLSLNIWNSDCRPHTFAQTSTLMSFITTHKTEMKKKAESIMHLDFLLPDDTTTKVPTDMRKNENTKIEHQITVHNYFWP